MSTKLGAATTTNAPQPKEFSRERTGSLRIYPGSFLRWTDDGFFDFCRRNSQWRIERNADGEIEIMEPSGWESGTMSGEGFFQTKAWANDDGTGKVADSSTGFVLPNTATRAGRRVGIPLTPRPDPEGAAQEVSAALSRLRPGDHIPLR